MPVQVSEEGWLVVAQRSGGLVGGPRRDSWELVASGFPAGPLGEPVWLFQAAGRTTLHTAADCQSLTRAQTQPIAAPWIDVAPADVCGRCGANCRPRR